ncbi:unnamed protein product [Rhizoctonia solani]|uniref:Uncharacterized protein n=1 Tax=Rhizoctonia solani TaxID=456999 RepID=A0A8H3BUA5_9AGAM|nr:unnamed protein product [Rhizoctonia solani]
MVLFSFKVVAALAAATAATVQASEHELESRDWEARRLVPRNFELITTKVTMLVPKGSYKTVTKYKTVTVTGDCGGGSVTTTDTFPLPITTDTLTTPTDTFTIPTLTDTGVPTPTDTLTGVPTPTDTGLPTDTLTGLPTDTLTGAPTPTDTLTGVPTPTDTGLPTDTLTAGGAGNTTTDPFATPTNTLTDPLLDPSSNATNPFASPTTTPGVADANATLAAGDPFASSPTLDIFGTSTDTVVVTITSDPTAPTPTAPSIVKRAVAQVI